MTIATNSQDQSRKTGRDLTWFVILFFLFVYGSFIHARAYSANDASRMAAVESLVHRRTWVIDQSPFGQTLDKIRVGDHFYSDKPPVLSFLAAGIYALLHGGLGLTLQSQGCSPDLAATRCLALLESEKADWAYFTLTLLLVALPGALMWGLAYRLARRNRFSSRGALALVLALGLGTAVFPYITVFVNHVPAVAALFAAHYLLLTRSQPSSRHLALAGLLSGTAVTFDLSAGVFGAGLLFYAALQYRRQAAWMVVGGLFPGLLMMVLDRQIVGNPWPPQLYAAGYAYSGSMLYANISGFNGPDNVLVYAFRMLLGDHGVLAFYPIAWWCLAALVLGVHAASSSVRRLAVVTAVSTTLYVLYFVFSTNNFGGFAYSPRWMLMPVPLLSLYALLDPALYRPMWRIALIIGLAVVSVASTFRGALNPWSPAYPLFRLTYAAPEPRQYVAAVLSGYHGFEEVDADLRRSFGVDRVVRRWVDARYGMVVPDGPAWWFIDESTPLAAEWAAALGLPGVAPFSLQADLSGQARQWAAALAHDAYRSDLLFPADAEATAVSLPVMFVREDGHISLLGYRWQQTEEQLTLLTAWRVETRRLNSPAPRRAFVHVLDEGGSVVAQSDFFAAEYATLFPGDMLFQTQTIPIGNLPAGSYWVQIGLYNPNSGARILTEAGDDRLLLRPLLRFSED